MRRLARALLDEFACFPNRPGQADVLFVCFISTLGLALFVLLLGFVVSLVIVTKGWLLLPLALVGVWYRVVARVAREVRHG